MFFASASQSYIDILAGEELIENNSREDFAQNSLVLIVPPSSTLNISGIEDLTTPEVERTAIGNPETAIPPPCKKGILAGNIPENLPRYWS